jgi:hypothetical protein
MSRARARRRYNALFRYYRRCTKVGGSWPLTRAYLRALDRVWVE